MRVRISVLLILMFILSILPGDGSIAVDQINTQSIAIKGDIVDNFANLSYTFVVSNPQSNDIDIDYQFHVDENLFLSNFSLQTPDGLYWGQVKESDQAQQDYDNAKENNQTAVLISVDGSKYQTKFNLKSGDTAIFTFYFQGYVFRVGGQYNFLIYQPAIGTNVNFDQVGMDIDVISSMENISKVKFSGFIANSVTKTKDNHLNFKYNVDNYDGSTLSIVYYVSNLYSGGKLMTYSNGTHNFFNYLFSPEIYDINQRIAREYVFVLDTSGSMYGERLTNAKSSFVSLLDTLDDGDYFNVIEFNSDATAFSTESISATELNVANAENWVNSLAAGGSTDIDTALKTAFSSFDNQRITAKVVVFLSDGVPTDGITSPDVIIDNARTANTNEAVLFSVSLGTQTEEELMATLAYRTGGNFMIVQDDADIEIGISKFYELFEIPVGIELGIYYNTSVSEVYPSQQLLANQVFNGSEVIQTGMFEGNLEITTSIFLSGGVARYVNSISDTNDSLSHVERIWAINQIKSLQRSLEIEDSSELRDKLVQIALRYQLVVEGYTSMIAVAVEEQQNTEETTQYSTRFDNGDAPQTITTPPVESVIDTLDDFTTNFAETGIFTSFVFVLPIVFYIIILKKIKLKKLL